MAIIKSPEHTGKRSYYRIRLSFDTPQEANAVKKLQKFFAKTYNTNGSVAVLKSLQELKLIPLLQDDLLRQDIRDTSVNVAVIRQILEDFFT